MKVKTLVRNIGDVAAREKAKEKKFGAAPVISPEQKVIDETVKKADTIRKELKVLSEQMKLPVDKRTPELFQKYGKLVSEEPVQVKIELLGELDDKGLEKVVDAMTTEDEVFEDPVMYTGMTPSEEAEERVREAIVNKEEELLIPGESIDESPPEYDDETIQERKKQMIGKMKQRDYNEHERKVINDELDLPDEDILFPLSKGKDQVSMRLTQARPILREVKKKNPKSKTMRVALDNRNYMIVGYSKAEYKPLTEAKFFDLLINQNNNVSDIKGYIIYRNEKLWKLLGEPNI